MASFRGHLATASVLGAAYGGAAFWYAGVPRTSALLGAVLTAVGGLLPDLDSDASVPNRTVFRLAGAGTTFLAFNHVLSTHYDLMRGCILLAGIYLAVRYVLGYCFRRLTVHRGMFHSIPAMLIAGLAVFLFYVHLELAVRAFLAGGIVVGFLSHLVLDEWCAVDFRGVRLKKPFGTALKLFSRSWLATSFCYGLLFVLTLLSVWSL